MNITTFRVVARFSKVNLKFIRVANIMVIGVLNTALFYVLYLVFLTLIEPAHSYYLAYVLSMIFATLMNLRFTTAALASFALLDIRPQ